MPGLSVEAKRIVSLHSCSKLLLNVYLSMFLHGCYMRGYSMPNNYSMLGVE